MIKIMSHPVYSKTIREKVKDLILNNVRKNSNILKTVSDRFKNDKDVVLAAVNHNGLTLEYASDELKNDKDVVLAAINHNGLALKYASEELKNDKAVVLAAVKHENNELIEYLKNNTKFDNFFWNKNMIVSILNTVVLKKIHDFE